MKYRLKLLFTVIYIYCIKANEIMSTLCFTYLLLISYLNQNIIFEFIDLLKIFFYFIVK